MMTFSNDDKSGICQFFIKTCSILSILYMHKCKNVNRQKFYWNTTCSFCRGPTRNPLPLEFQKSAAQVGLKQKRIKQNNFIKGVFIPKLLNNPLAFFSIIDFFFSTITLCTFWQEHYSSVFSPYNLRIFTFCIFSTPQTIRQHYFINSLIV